MKNTIKISLTLAFALHRTNKDFLFYNLSRDKKPKILNYTLSNDIIRNRKLYAHFKVMSCIKNSINNITI